MTSAFSWQKNCQLLPCFIFYSKATLACYSRYLLNSYFCILVPYDEKAIFFWCQFYKVLQVFIESFNFSFFSISGIYKIYFKSNDSLGTICLQILGITTLMLFSQCHQINSLILPNGRPLILSGILGCSKVNGEYFTQHLHSLLSLLALFSGS